MSVFVLLALIVSSAFAKSPLAEPGLSSQIYEISGYENHICTRNHAGMKCWGNGDWHPNGWSEPDLNPPTLANPRKIAAGTGLNCALDDSGLHCWGATQTNGRINELLPVAKGAAREQLSVGRDMVCLLADEKLDCWGFGSEFGKVHIENLKPIMPALKNPRQVSVGNDDACALDDEGIKCWGSANYAEVGHTRRVETLKNPRFVNVGTWSVCAIDDEGVKCWGMGKGPDEKTQASFKNPRIVRAGLRDSCVLDDEGVKCWGEHYSRIDRAVKLPPMKHPRDILMTNNEFACALDDDGLVCWRHYDGALLNMNGLRASLEEPRFQLDRLDSYFSLLRQASSSPRARFLSALSTTMDPELFALPGSREMDRELDLARYLLVEFTAPAIESATSGYFAKTAIPYFEASREQARQALQKAYPDARLSLSDLPFGARTNRVALSLVLTALNEAKAFLPENEKGVWIDCARAVALAERRPQDTALLRQALNTFQGLERSKANLQSDRSAFLVHSLDLAAEWLEEKVK